MSLCTAGPPAAHVVPPACPAPFSNSFSRTEIDDDAHMAPLTRARRRAAPSLVDGLPTEMLVHTLQFRTAAALGRAACVSLAWRRAVALTAEAAVRRHHPQWPQGSDACPCWLRSLWTIELLLDRVGPDPASTSSDRGWRDEYIPLHIAAGQHSLGSAWLVEMGAGIASTPWFERANARTLDSQLAAELLTRSPSARMYGDGTCGGMYIWHVVAVRMMACTYDGQTLRRAASRRSRTRSTTRRSRAFSRPNGRRTTSPCSRTLRARTRPPYSRMPSSNARAVSQRRCTPRTGRTHAPRSVPSPTTTCRRRSTTFYTARAGCVRWTPTGHASRVCR
jgi:hypothetical protein